MWANTNAGSKSIGHSINFNGFNEYIDLGDNLGFERNQTRSLVAWVKMPYSPNAAGVIVATYDGSSSFSGVQVYIDNVAATMTDLNPGGSLSATIITTEPLSFGR